MLTLVLFFTGEAQPKDIPNCDYEITYAFESVKELYNEYKK